MSSLVADLEPQTGDPRKSSFLNRIFRKSTANTLESLTEESKGDKTEETKQLQQPHFVMHLQQKIAQIRYGKVRYSPPSTIALKNICVKEISNKSRLCIVVKQNR